ncbi:MAG: serine protease [bacterium]|nr:serine protease [bacterium]
MKTFFSLLLLSFLFGCTTTTLHAGLPSSVQAYLPVTALQRSVVKMLTIRGNDVGEGSAFFAGAPGHLVTNAHVVDGASHFYVFITAPDGQSVAIHQATMKHMDKTHDLAVLEVLGENLPPAIPLATTDALLMQDVVSIGYPGDIDEDYAKSIIAKRLRPGNVFNEPAVLAYLLPHFTKGHIGKIVPGRFYHTAAIDRGNSGGPLVNQAGEVVGINRSATSDPFYPFYFAIPVQHLRELLVK